MSDLTVVLALERKTDKPALDEAMALALDRRRGGVVMVGWLQLVGRCDQYPN